MISTISFSGIDDGRCQFQPLYMTCCHLSGHIIARMLLQLIHSCIDDSCSEGVNVTVDLVGNLDLRLCATNATVLCIFMHPLYTAT